jgi:hypothetical protein
MNPQIQQKGTEKQGQADPKKSDKNVWLNDSMLIFARFSSWVAGPVFLGIILGKWLETKFPANGQFIFLACIGTAFLISMFGLVMEANKEYRRIAGEDKEKQKKDI